jgi:hypothetical protein
MRESSIHSAVMSHWRKLGKPGTLVSTIPNAGAFGQAGLTKGLPDLLIMAPGLPVGFIELKTDKGRVSPYQEAFRAHCISLGIPMAITRGRDEPIKILEDWGVTHKAAK